MGWGLAVQGSGEGGDRLRGRNLRTQVGSWLDRVEDWEGKGGRVEQGCWDGIRRDGKEVGKKLVQGREAGAGPGGMEGRGGGKLVAGGDGGLE